MEPMISARDLVKSYPLPAGDFTALGGISLDVAAGEFVAVVGRSGSGKTTLLNLLAGIDRPTSGTLRVAGADLGSSSDGTRGSRGSRGRPRGRPRGDSSDSSDSGVSGSSGGRSRGDSSDSGSSISSGGGSRGSGGGSRGLSEAGLAAWRGRSIGLVFQFFQLLPTLTVAENVMLPMDFAGTVPPARRRDRAMQWLERVGVADQANKLPSTLSGGQQQRAAIARALANDPPLLLADEPTGNLDSATSAAVLELLAGLNADGRTIVVVTHEREVRAVANREIALRDGQIVQSARAAS